MTNFNEPITDAVRAILDGHVVLSRDLAAMGHYPAIDILNSVSRLANRVATQEQRAAARAVREALADYRQSEDLINLGAYVAGANARPRLRHPPATEASRFPPAGAEANEPLTRTLEQLRGLAGQMA